MLMIRLARFGAKKKPSYRVVVIDKERARDSRAVEVVGTYHPVATPKSVLLKHDRIAYWRSQGAQFSTIVAKLVDKNPEQVPAADPVEAAFTAFTVGRLMHHRWKYSAIAFDGSGTNCGNSLETKQPARSAGTTAKDAFQANRRL